MNPIYRHCSHHCTFGRVILLNGDGNHVNSIGFNHDGTKIVTDRVIENVYGMLKW